ncbi:hypothetical protein KKD70_04390 [Patescibacteria group bacterium]|nr:hypothetical protein [Patescibacteria group bacterium]
MASFPFFFLLFWAAPYLKSTYIIITALIIIAFFSIVIIYLALIYWLDKLVITNKRVIHIDWLFLTKKAEGEALLYDIQDIHTQERGILSALYLFDYGVIRLETASSKTTIRFTEAPDPEGIKEFVSDAIKHCRPNNSGALSNPDPLFNGIGVRR